MTGRAGLLARWERAWAALRHALTAHEIRRSGAFDRHWYLATHDVPAGWDPVVHYLARGARNGARPHPLFDPPWWCERRERASHANPLIDYLRAPERWECSPSPYLDVSAEQDHGAGSPLGRYVASGGRAGLAVSPLFDAAFYLANNPDIAEAGFDPLLHYGANGGREGRSPCVAFDAFWYLSVNRDVKARGEEPLRHFLMRGAVQARAPHRAIDLPMLCENTREADPIAALRRYQDRDRHGLAALTHPRLPPPGALAPLLDDWPWQAVPADDRRPRHLILVVGSDFVEGLPTVLATGAAPWLVALDVAAAEACQAARLPWLDLATGAEEALKALLRAVRFADPHLRLSVMAPPAHAVHGLTDTAATAGPVARAVEPPATISVIVPCYNHAAYLGCRLASIVAQRRAPCEIIVIDDASQDDSVACARAFATRSPIPVRVVARTGNSGSPFATWAEGAALASGELLWIAESDDDADPRLLERLAPFLEADPQVLLAYCQSAVIGAKGERLADDHLFYTDTIDRHRWEAPYRVAGEVEIAQALAIKNTIPNVSAVLFRRRDLLDIGPQIAADRYCGDWRAYALLAERGDVGYTPEPLNRTRRHGLNATLTGERSLVAVREAQCIRMALWQRPQTPLSTIRAGYAQHRLEIASRDATAESAEVAAAERGFAEAIAALLRERESALPAVSASG